MVIVDELVDVDFLIAIHVHLIEQVVHNFSESLLVLLSLLLIQSISAHSSAFLVTC